MEKYKTKKYIPLDNLVFFTWEEQETSGGIVLAQTRATIRSSPFEFAIGTVTEVGDNCVQVKVGDKIYFNWRRVNPIWVENRLIERLYLPEDEVFAIQK